MEENIESNAKTQDNRRKKWAKWAMVGLWLLASFWLLVFLTLWLLFLSKPNRWIDILWTYLAIILIALYVEILIVYYVFSRKSKTKNNRYLRDILIISFTFLILIWIALTKALFIPDYFELNCLWNKRVFDNRCVDCKCAVLSTSTVSVDAYVKIDWKECCEWTYKINRLHGAN